MSMFCHTRTAFKDRAALVEALMEQGFTADQIEVHDEAQHLYGYLGDQRAQKANVIIRKKNIGSASNDIGFCKVEDGTYEAIISSYDSKKYDGAWLIKLKKSYSEGIVKKQFKQKNISTQIQRREDGTIRVVGYVKGN